MEIPAREMSKKWSPLRYWLPRSFSTSRLRVVRTPSLAVESLKILSQARNSGRPTMSRASYSPTKMAVIPSTDRLTTRS